MATRMKRKRDRIEDRYWSAYWALERWYVVELAPGLRPLSKLQLRHEGRLYKKLKRREEALWKVQVQEMFEER